MRCAICGNLRGGRCSCTLQAYSRATMAAGQVQSDWNRKKINVSQATKQFQQIRNTNWDKNK